MLAQYFQVSQTDATTMAVTDPRAAVAIDVALLRSIPALPDARLISSLIYDVATGRIEMALPPVPSRGS
jgi:carbonic anhydrase